MFLKRLQISNNNNIVRDIEFRKGLNLIVDETETASKTESGNNVGKTTVLRLIDYCFGSKGTNIYEDPEFKEKSNTQVKYFLTNNNIIVTLVLQDDLESESSREIVIRRNFLRRKEKLLEIDGVQLTAKEFRTKLKCLVFGSQQEKPTIKQIVAKNIRDEKNRLNNTLKVLSPYATIEEYESLFLFWLGIEADSNARKQQLIRNKKAEENVLKRLRREATLSQINQSLRVVDRSIDELVARKNSFTVNEKYEYELNELNRTKRQIASLATTIGTLELRQELIEESLRELEQEKSSISTDHVRSLYREARLLFPQLQKTFEETVLFHNQMVENKRNYISRELPSIRNELVEAKRRMSAFLVNEKRLATRLKKTGVVNELQEIVSQLNDVYERKGKLEEQKRIWETSIAEIKAIDSELDAINSGLDSKDQVIEERIAEFNKYFSRISSQLYGEQFVLSADRHERGYQLNISSISGNLGTGKKKGQIAAFDLAYIQFADALGIDCLHFVLQDQMENVHDNQITSLLTEVVSEVNCQYILPVLRDKLPKDIDVNQYEILSLSQSDKLFRL